MDDARLEPYPEPLPVSLRTLANGRYTLVRKVAEGGTAMVHLGYDNVDGQWRAIKTLLPEYARRPALKHRFEREAITMKALSHPNVIRVYDAGADEETAWLVMEYADAGSVIDWVERHGPMPPRMAVEVVLQLCDGIQAAHEDGIIHRDIKPQNLLVARDGSCKVTDFGIAQVVHETRMTMTGTVMGTVGYMAPEQHESAKHADERADVYSIAATLYALVKAEAANHLFMADDHEFQGFPPSLADIVRRGAQYRRDLRYESVAEMARELRAALAGLPPDPLDTPPLVPDDLATLDTLVPPTATPSTVVPRPAGDDPILRTDSSEVGSPTSGSKLRRDSDTGSHADPTSSSVIPRRAPPAEDTSARRFEVSHSSRAESLARLRSYGVVAATVLGMAFLVTLAMVLVSAASLDHLTRIEQREQAELYAEFREQVVILPVLDTLNPPPRSLPEVHSLFDRLDREKDPVARRAAARRLQELLKIDLQRELAMRNSPSETAQRKQLEVTTDTLEQALREHDLAERGVAEERQTFWGGLATRMGF